MSSLKSTDSISTVMNILQCTDGIFQHHWWYPFTKMKIKSNYVIEWDKRYGAMPSVMWKILWRETTVLNILHSTDCITPQYWWYTSSTVLNILHSTDRIPWFWFNPSTLHDITRTDISTCMVLMKLPCKCKSSSSVQLRF